MDWFVRWFLKASLAWLALGVTAGVAMAVRPAWTVYRAAHLHMLLIGFVTMMIFGVAYHVVPRFAGFPLPSRKLAGLNWWLANVGLAAMTCGFVLRVRDAVRGTIVLSIGGALSALSAYLFAMLLWRTLDGSKAMRDAKELAHRARALARSSGRADLPVA